MAVEGEASEAAVIHSSASDEPDASPDGVRRSRISPRARLILLVLAAVVAVAGTLWYLRYSSYGRYQQSTNDAYIQSDATIVSPKVGGYVERVFVIDNQQVKRGDPLLSIDPRDYRAQAQQAQAQIGIAAAGADSIRAQIREQQAAIAQARAQLAYAENGVRFTRSEVARYTPLAATGAETREHLAALRSQERQATSQAASARAALAAAERRVGTLQAQVGQAQSQRRAAEAQLAAADVNLGSTLIRAATAGRIGDKNVQPGQFVQPGLRMMTIVPMQRLYVEANFKETQLGLLRVGQPVTISVDALDGVELHGRVESVSPGTGAQFSLLPPQNATGNFTKIVQRVPVRISLDAGPRTRSLLVPGMSVEVSVDTRSARHEREVIDREEEARGHGRRGAG